MTRAEKLTECSISIMKSVFYKPFLDRATLVEAYSSLKGFIEKSLYQGILLIAEIVKLITPA